MACTHHGHVNIASIQLHVDLLVDHGFGIGMKVKPDARHDVAWFFKNDKKEKLV